jgi:hypothetical protein
LVSVWLSMGPFLRKSLFYKDAMTPKGSLAVARW